MCIRDRYQLVYLRQLRKQRKYAELRREAAKSRDVLWPLARRRLSQRRKRLPTRRLLRPAFMAFSIESRVPYLDQELVDHILSLPDDAIIRDGWSRWILRAALKGTLPEKIRLRRWKVGFTTPEMRWIKARRAAFTSLYQSPSFQARQYWDGAAVVSAFRGCCRGEVEESMFFWRAANVELWLREFVDRGAVLADADVEAALTAPVSYTHLRAHETVLD